MEGTRVKVRSEKKNPEDFALWKKAEPEHVMRWPSPWGEGFPGWHIECSAMSMKYLGETFDIHGGGLDNQFPHHECEIAQSEGATGKPFAKYWVHNNLVTVNGQKMSKSLGNFVTLKEAVKNYDPLVIRLFILQSHYRSTLDFSNEALDGAKSGWEKLRNTYTNIKNELNKAETSGKSGTVKVDVDGYRARFLEAMNEDFNTPQALGVLFDLSRDMNQALMSEAGVSKESLAKGLDLFEHGGNTVLGFLGSGIASTPSSNGAGEPELIQLFIELRNTAKSEKNYAFSDRIRESLKKLGVLLEDKKDGTTVWKKL
jgi:cysteinyl-tRNA synthetase